MRTLFLVPLALALCTGLGVPARADDAAKIVDQYIKAAGGAQRISKLPNRYYSELVAGDQSWIEAYNGKSAWHQNGVGEVATSLGQESSQLEAAGNYYNARLVNSKKNKLALALLGHAQVRARDAFEIEVTAANGMKQQVYFDAGTHLIVEEKAAIGGVEEAMLYGDYRTVDGVQLPYQIELRRGSDSYQIAVTRVQVNGVIEDRVFDFPKQSQVQLPDLAALFKKIDENQKALRKITESKDGKPLSEQEQKKQDEKTRRRIEELQKHEAKKEAKEKKDAEQGREDKNNGDPGIEVFLRACQFTNPRRERFRGQDVLVFDFAPNPEFKPRKLEEKVVQKLAGVVWIDEKALDVARLEAYFVGDMKMAGGLLANVQKGTSLVLEQAFINNEVWLPTYEEAQVGARVLLVKGFKISHVTRYSDYKKFDVQTLAATGKLKEGSKP